MGTARRRHGARGRRHAGRRHAQHKGSEPLGEMGVGKGLAGSTHPDSDKDSSSPYESSLGLGQEHSDAVTLGSGSASMDQLHSDGVTLGADSSAPSQVPPASDTTEGTLSSERPEPDLVTGAESVQAAEDASAGEGALGGTGTGLATGSESAEVADASTREGELGAGRGEDAGARNTSKPWRQPTVPIGATWKGALHPKLFVRGQLSDVDILRMKVSGKQYCIEAACIDCVYSTEYDESTAR